MYSKQLLGRVFLAFALLGVFCTSCTDAPTGNQPSREQRGTTTPIQGLPTYHLDPNCPLLAQEVQRGVSIPEHFWAAKLPEDGIVNPCDSCVSQEYLQEQLPTFEDLDGFFEDAIEMPKKGTHQCPNCGEWSIPADPSGDTVTCPDCDCVLSSRFVDYL